MKVWVAGKNITINPKAETGESGGSMMFIWVGGAEDEQKKKIVDLSSQNRHSRHRRE